MTIPTRRARKLAIRIVIATVLGWTTWWCYLNGGRWAGLPRVVYHVLDWPVATVGLLFKGYWAGIDAFYRQNLCDFCTSRQLLGEHLKFAIPVYVLLLYVPDVLRVAAKRFRSRRRGPSSGRRIGSSDTHTA